MNFEKTSLGLAAVTTGLVAGLFFAYQVSVNPAFKKLPDGEYIRAMQAINVAIQNPIFLSCFTGNLLFLGAATYLHRAHSSGGTSKLLLAASVLYAIGVFGVTVAGNVPLNDALAKVSLASSTPAQLAAARSSFQEPWNDLHLVRTIASVVCLVLVVAACLSSTGLKTERNENRPQKTLR